MVPRKLLNALREKKYKTFLICAHVHLEGDALGSQLSLASLLRRMGKKVVCRDEDAPPPEYHFLPGIDSISSSCEPLDYDAAILVDCSDVSRIGKIQKILDKKKPIFNIDHHVSNTRFGDVNWVDGHVSSASEMIFELFCALKMKPTRDEAMLIYTGILVDTGSFKYTTTTARTHEVAACLLRRGLDVYGIYRLIHEGLPPGLIRVFGKIISTLQVSRSGKIASLSVKYAWIKKEPLLAEQTDAIIAFARSLKDVEVALLFKEIKPRQEIRVNLRSLGVIDVNECARLFGGGGHRMASGCTLKGNLKDAVERLTQALEEKIEKED